MIAWLGQQEPELKDGLGTPQLPGESRPLIGVDLTALAPANPAQAGSVGERTLTLDGVLLRDLDLTTAAYERMRHRVPGRHLMRQVVGHIELTQDVVCGSPWPAQRQRLLANLSQTASLLSWLQFFDQGDRAAARTWLMRGSRAALESGDSAGDTDAGITDRDVAALRWLGQRYAARSDVLRVLLGRLSPGSPRVEGQPGETTLRDLVTRWEDRGLVDRDRLLGHLWVAHTVKALRLIGLEVRAWSFVIPQLAHV